ncbi:hypothetical protein K438DRAFT_1838915 [Mycena galopus ATCC 62051]|nr:hypothetical protein K438DRAFT_1838915 [Mycena galopus ATCC 62051]
MYLPSTGDAVIPTLLPLLVLLYSPSPRYTMHWHCPQPSPSLPILLYSRIHAPPPPSNLVSIQHLPSTGHVHGNGHAPHLRFYLFEAEDLGARAAWLSHPHAHTQSLACA